MPNIVADENIPFAREAFAPFGTLRLLPGRSIDRSAVAAADALVVRSVTKVDAALLEGTSIRFVGTATTGTDHIDAPALAELGVTFMDAAGSNANSVAEYVLAALLEWEAAGSPLAGRTLGIVGHGRIGSAVAKLAPRLVMGLLTCDPPLARSGTRNALGASHLPLPEVLANADIVSVHVPLVRSGEDRTVGMLGATELAMLRPSALLLNAARGDVLDGKALLAALREERLAGAVLDTWENEPEIDRELLSRCFIATPHIAGYSHDGKIAGTSMMATALARHFGIEAPSPLALPSVDTPLALDPALRGHDALRTAVRAAYDIRGDDAALRAASSAMGPHFDSLRKNYPKRREFAAWRVAPHPERENLRRFGFSITED